MVDSANGPADNAFLENMSPRSSIAHVLAADKVSHAGQSASEHRVYLLLNKGVIVERGKHEDLVALDAAYTMLVESVNQGS